MLLWVFDDIFVVLYSVIGFLVLLGDIDDILELLYEVFGYVEL